MKPRAISVLTFDAKALLARGSGRAPTDHAVGELRPCLSSPSLPVGMGRKHCSAARARCRPTLLARSLARGGHTQLGLEGNVVEQHLRGNVHLQLGPRDGQQVRKPTRAPPNGHLSSGTLRPPGTLTAMRSTKKALELRLQDFGHLCSAGIRRGKLGVSGRGEVKSRIELGGGWTLSQARPPFDVVEGRSVLPPLTLSKG